MDDQATQLLREIREILLRNETRDSEWMRENRQMYQYANEKNLKHARQNHIAVWILLTALIAVVAMDVFAHLRDSGIV